MAVSYKNRIRSLRKKLKMTQEQMAEQLFIDQTTLSMNECGNRDIPVSILMELSTTYGVSVDYLLYKSDFAVPDTIVKLNVDLDELNNNQKVMLAGDEVKDINKIAAYFSGSNVPRVYSKPRTYIDEDSILDDFDNFKIVD